MTVGSADNGDLLSAGSVECVVASGEYGIRGGMYAAKLLLTMGCPYGVVVAENGGKLGCTEG